MPPDIQRRYDELVRESALAEFKHRAETRDRIMCLAVGFVWGLLGALMFGRVFG